MKKLSLVIGALGFACLGLYSEIKTGSGTFFYIGSFVCFLGLIE